MIIEEYILKHIEKVLDVPVFLEEPLQAPDEYVIFEKVGSAESNHLGSSMFAFQSYAKSLYQAALLNKFTKMAVESLIELDRIASVKLNSDYNYTDTATKRYRYQAVYQINHY